MGGKVSGNCGLGSHLPEPTVREVREEDEWTVDVWLLLTKAAPTAETSGAAEQNTCYRNSRSKEDGQSNGEKGRTSVTRRDVPYGSQ